MHGVRGTPVNINGRTAGTPGPAPGSASPPLRVEAPVPAGRQKTLPDGTVSKTNFSKTFARYLTITNLDATNDMRVYFLDSNFVTVLKGTSKEFSGEISFFLVQSAGVAAAQWEATAVVAA